MNKSYNYGLELLRIISMIYIISFHIADHGVVNIWHDQSLPITLNWVVLAIMSIGGGLGNCIFVIISGYLLIHKEINFKRIRNLWIETLFYSISIGIVAWWMYPESISLKFLKGMIFPVMYNQYWFISSYIVLMLILPFFNDTMYRWDKVRHKKFIIIGVFIFSIIPTFTYNNWMDGSNNVFLFIFLYAIGGYIRKYYESVSFRYVFLIVMLLIIFLVSTIVTLKYINIVFETKLDVVRFVWPMFKFPVLVASVSVFLAFKQLKINNFTGFITFFSSSVFAVYLIHIGRLQEYLFKVLLDDTEVYQSQYFPLWCLVMPIIIFIICVLIDKLRLLMFSAVRTIFENRKLN